MFIHTLLGVRGVDKGFFPVYFTLIAIFLHSLLQQVLQSINFMKQGNINLLHYSTLAVPSYVKDKALLPYMLDVTNILGNKLDSKDLALKSTISMYLCTYIIGFGNIIDKYLAYRQGPISKGLQNIIDDPFHKRV